MNFMLCYFRIGFYLIPETFRNISNMSIIKACVIIIFFILLLFFFFFWLYGCVNVGNWAFRTCYLVKARH